MSPIHLGIGIVSMAQAGAGSVTVIRPQEVEQGSVVFSLRKAPYWAPPQTNTSTTANWFEASKGSITADPADG